MHRKTVFSVVTALALVAGFCVVNSMQPPVTDTVAEESTGSYIVQGRSLEEVTRAVHSVHARVTRELGIINAVAAKLDADQRADLRLNENVVKIVETRTVSTAASAPAGPGAYAPVATLVGADALRAGGSMGQAVTVAILDSVDHRVGQE